MAKKKKKGSTGRRIARGIKGNLKSRGMLAGVGAAVALAQSYAQGEIEFIRDNWYGAPLAMFGASLLVKHKEAGTALAVLAGSSAVFNYKLAQFQQGKEKTSPVPQFKPPEQKPGALPVAAAPQPAADTGMRQSARMSDDAGMLYAS